MQLLPAIQLFLARDPAPARDPALSCPRSSSFLPVIQLLLDMLVEVVLVEEEEV